MSVVKWQQISILKKNVKAKHYHITFEPLFEDVGTVDLEDVDWVVIGAETGNRKGKIIPQKDWIMNIVRQAKDKNISITMKTSLIDIVGKENFIQEVPNEFEKIWNKN